MKLVPSVLELNFPHVEERIKRFIKDYVEKSGAKGIVIGMSGGIDSNTTAALAALAVGGDKVLGLMLPEQETFNKKDIEDASIVAQIFGIKTQICDMTQALEQIYKSIPIFNSNDRICKGNIKARARMIYLYYFANQLGYLVCGSSDKSETMMGYFTKWGDVAADISPLMDLYKTQVRKLAEHLGIPHDLAAKPSTPALWPGQSAEGELGVKYELLDLILFGLERFMSPQDIATQLNVSLEMVENVKHRWLTIEHKRRMPLTAKLEFRTIGMDFRLPRTSH